MPNVPGSGKVFTAPTDVVLDPALNAVQPDRMFIASARIAAIGEDKIEGAPDSVVEVLSEATRRRDLGSKLRVCARYDVGVYRAVDPEDDVVRVYDVVEGGYGEPAFLRRGQRLGCPLFPGVEADVAEVFTE